MNQTMTPNRIPGQGGVENLAAEITKSGSRQTYYTFLLLADRDRREQAFRCYAYFRWLDDRLDCNSGSRLEKSAFLKHQQELLEACYRREQTGDACPEELMLVELVRDDREKSSGMQVYLRNMMAVMAFDVERCGRSITPDELAEYTRLLATAVTEVLFYLIGHHDAPPEGDTRYHAVSGAHMVHMLRDMLEDFDVGYYNFPAAFLTDGPAGSDTFQSLPFRQWVKERAGLARKYFMTGREYISRVKNPRCRLAGFAYLARFEWMLRLIERDDYRLRADYPERKSFRALIWIAWRVLASSVNLPGLSPVRAGQPTLGERGEGR